MGSETISKVHDSRLYKSLLPLVGPLTEPAVKRILESPTFQVRVWSTFSIKPSLKPSCRVRTSHLPGYSPAAAQPCAVPATGAAAAAAAAGCVAAVFQVSGFSADDSRAAKRQAVKEHLAPMPPSDDVEQPMQPRLLTA